MLCSSCTGSEGEPRDRGGLMFDWSTYPLPSGTETQHGTIEFVSLTGYLIDGEWYDHTAVHGSRGIAEPLVVIA